MIEENSAGKKPWQQGVEASGIFALADFDGRPLDPLDLQKLGLQADGNRSWTARAQDLKLQNCVHVEDTADEYCLLVGYVDEVEGLAQRLGLAADAPVARVACAALKKFGSELAAEMLGEWSMFYRDPSGWLTLSLSAARRDRLFYSVVGSKVAIAPNLHAIAALPWVDRAIDDYVLLLSMGSYDLRCRIGDNTILRGIKSVEPGAIVTICPSGATVAHTSQVFPQPEVWRGSLADAVAEADWLMRAIATSHWLRTSNIACLLSGGLDSSLLAAYLAETRPSDGKLNFIASVAPKGSGIPDERDYAQLAAVSLGGVLTETYPPFSANSYRPSSSVMVGANGPLMSNRIPLTEAFQAQASKLGAAMMINGTYGEFHMTARLAPPRLRSRLKDVLRIPRSASASASDLFHPRIANERLLSVSNIQPASSSPLPSFPPDRVGYLPGAEKSLLHANEFYPGAVRMAFPYRDLRLLRFMATLPRKSLASIPGDRALGRALLDGKLPDKIRMRKIGMPAFPDHMQRLRSQAAAARTRIAHFRRYDVHEWFDLNWIDSALQRFSDKGPDNVADANNVQLTVLNAEYLCWLREEAGLS